MPGKRTLAQRFRYVSLSQNIPDYAFDAGTGLGNACGQRLHFRPSDPVYDATAEARLMQRDLVQP
jgi:hypothetical protein